MKVFIRKYLRDLFNPRLLKKAEASAKLELFLGAQKKRADGATSEPANSEQRTTGTSQRLLENRAQQERLQSPDVKQASMAKDAGQLA